VVDVSTRLLPPERLTAFLSRTPPPVACMAIEPSMWLVRGASPLPIDDGLAVDVGDAYAQFAVDGAGAADLLAQGMSLDFERLPPNFVGRARLGEAAVIVEKTAAGFVLLCERSYAEYLSAWLVHAASFNPSTGDI
jgi:sarcosine oxidase gamma subunit